MDQQQIKTLQSRIGAEPDGFWGHRSVAACQAHLRALMPGDNPWPGSSESELREFYGNAGDENKLVNLDVTDLDVRYDGNRVKTIRCHSKVAASLKRVLVSIAATHPEILRDYCGCFNFRKMRGGSSYSLHARGAAIDFAADQNGNSAHWPTRANMPIEVMEAFAREGWLAAGAFWSRDAMHAQATR